MPNNKLTTHYDLCNLELSMFNYQIDITVALHINLEMFYVMIAISK